jgi:hypothetical protein
LTRPRCTRSAGGRAALKCPPILTAIARQRARPAELSEDLEFLQPYPDRLLEDLVARETVELAFTTPIQLLPPKQRAVLILRDWLFEECGLPPELT